MRILSLRVKHVRMHEDRTIEFDRERTLVAGPNESGKSTLVEAIERVLCYPHRSNADNLEGLRPRAGGGPPEVVLRFERRGRVYQIHKIFRGPQSVARLTDQDGNEWSGDDAEERLRRLLGFDDTSLKSRFRGWSHLWARQGRAHTDPTSREALGDATAALDARLKHMAGSTLIESRRDTATSRRIVEEDDATYTHSGGVRTTSRLGCAQVELQSAEAAAREAAARLAEFEAAADTVVREETLIRETRKTLADAESHLRDVRELLARIEALERTLAVQRDDAIAAAASHDALRKADADIAQLATLIDERSATLAPKERELERLSAHERQLERAVAAALTAIEESTENRRRAAVSEDLLKSVERVVALDSERTRLEATLSRLAVLEADVAVIDMRLRALPDIDRSSVEELEGLERQLEIGHAKLAASATRIEVTRVGAMVEVDGQSLDVGRTLTITGPADVTIEPSTTIRITPGGGASLLELRADVARIATHLTALLDRHGLKAVTDAERVLEQRLFEDVARGRLQSKIDALEGNATRKRLEEITGDIRKLEAEIERKRSVDFARPTDALAIADALRGEEGRRSEADEAVRRAHTHFEAAKDELSQARRARESLADEWAAERRELQELGIQKAALERVYGTDRSDSLRMAADVMVSKQAAAAGTERVIESLDPSTVRIDKDRYERTVTVTADLINDATIRRAGAEGELRRGGILDLHGMKAEADGRLELARRQLTEVQQRALAVRRLRELFARQREAVAEVLAAPLRTKAAEYLDALFGAGSRVAVSKSGEALEDLRVARPVSGDGAFAFDELSGGAREQVAAACRLAMAEVIAAGETDDGGTSSGCLPMVFDDAFVNSDPERIRALQRVLDLGARRGLQIIVLSCNPQEYGLFGAKRIDLPPPRPAATTIPLAPGGSTSAGSGESGDGVADSGARSTQVTAAGDDPSDDDALSAMFLAALASMPQRKAGNTSLRARLAWDERTFERIKDRLVTAGCIERGKGRGGSVRLADDFRSTR